MYEILICTGVLVVGIGLVCMCLISEIRRARDMITAKQDALMKKMIELKIR